MSPRSTMLTGISGSKHVLIASQTAFSLNSPAAAPASPASSRPSIFAASARAIRKSPRSVLTVTLPPRVCTTETSSPAASVTAVPAGMAVAGQSSERRWVMGSPAAASADVQVHRHPGVDAVRVVERAQLGKLGLEPVGDLPDHPPVRMHAKAGRREPSQRLGQRLGEVLGPRVFLDAGVGPEARLLARVRDRLL